ALARGAEITNPPLAEPRHLGGVGLIEMEAPADDQRRLVEAVVLPGILSADEVDQDALPQPALHRGDRLQPQVLHQLLEDDRARAHDLRSASVEPLAPLGR